MSEQKNVLLVDGTRLFFVARDIAAKNLDYEALSEILLDHFDAQYEWDEAILYSTFDPKNEKQSSFLDFIEQKIEWEVKKFHVADIDPVGLHGEGDVKDRLRFDVHIAQKLGELSNQDVKVCILSDSYPLLAASRAYPKMHTSFAFFARSCDHRWKRHLAEISFINLDNHYEDLFCVETSAH